MLTFFNTNLSHTHANNRTPVVLFEGAVLVSSFSDIELNDVIELYQSIEIHYDVESTSLGTTLDFYVELDTDFIKEYPDNTKYPLNTIRTYDTTAIVLPLVDFTKTHGSVINIGGTFTGYRNPTVRKVIGYAK